MEKANNVFTTLEEKYPEFDRRPDWMLTGFYTTTNSNKPKKTMSNPEGLVPMWRFVNWNKNSKYTGAMLREIRNDKTKR